MPLRQVDLLELVIDRLPRMTRLPVSWRLALPDPKVWNRWRMGPFTPVNGSTCIYHILSSSDGNGQGRETQELDDPVLECRTLVSRLVVDFPLSCPRSTSETDHDIAEEILDAMETIAFSGRSFWAHCSWKKRNNEGLIGLLDCIVGFGIDCDAEGVISANNIPTHDPFINSLEAVSEDHYETIRREFCSASYGYQVLGTLTATPNVAPQDSDSFRYNHRPDIPLPRELDFWGYRTYPESQAHVRSRTGVISFRFNNSLGIGRQRTQSLEPPVAGTQVTFFWRQCPNVGQATGVVMIHKDFDTETDDFNFDGFSEDSLGFRGWVSSNDCHIFDGRLMADGSYICGTVIESHPGRDENNARCYSGLVTFAVVF